MALKFLICGLEHTGTTLVSELFRQVPGLDSGFECGVLLRDTVSEFLNLQPFARQMLVGWGITQEQLAFCCDAPDVGTFYERLLAESTVLAEGTTQIFDKTPRYLQCLGAVMKRVDVPLLVTYKDPRAIVCSDFKRAKGQDFDSWYEDYMPRKRHYVENCYNQFMRHRTSPRVETVRLEDLAMDARATMERMFAHVEERFRIDYSVIGTLRYKNVRSRTVSAEIAFEYKARLSPEAQKRVEKDFAQFDQWFYS